MYIIYNVKFRFNIPNRQSNLCPPRTTPWRPERSSAKTENDLTKYRPTSVPVDASGLWGAPIQSLRVMQMLWTTKKLMSMISADSGERSRALWLFYQPYSLEGVLTIFLLTGGRRGRSYLRSHCVTLFNLFCYFCESFTLRLLLAIKFHVLRKKNNFTKIYVDWLGFITCLRVST